MDFRSKLKKLVKSDPRVFIVSKLNDFSLLTLNDSK